MTNKKSVKLLLAGAAVGMAVEAIFMIGDKTAEAAKNFIAKKKAEGIIDEANEIFEDEVIDLTDKEAEIITKEEV